MFSELLKNRIFTAEALKTDLSSVLFITLDSSTKEVNDALERSSAQHEDYDNIIIKEGECLKGFIPREKLKKIKGDLSSQYIKFDNYIFSANESIDNIITRISKDMEKSEFPRIYLISKEENQMGVMTYADLNRRSVYIYNYIIISFVEQWLRARIAQNYKEPGRILSEKWMNSLKQNVRNKLLGFSSSKHESTLSVASLKDLIYVFKNDSSFEELRSRFGEVIPDETLNDIISIRDRIMHPTKLLVSKNKKREDMQILKRISKLSTDFLVRKDRNEKNQGWASFPL